MAKRNVKSIELRKEMEMKRALSMVPQEILDDFRKFLYVVWKHLRLPDPTPVQYAIAYHLQHGPKRKIIEGFRGVGKSWITSAYVCWLLLRNPQEKILVVSASKDRANDFSTFTLRLLKEIPYLQHLVPRADQRESKIAFDVAPALAAHAASVKSSGIFGQITGSRATHIVADDIEVAQNALTSTMREKLLNAVGEFEAILVPEGEPTITFLGTPQTNSTVYNKLKTRGYTLRVWPARYPELNAETVLLNTLDPKLMNDLLVNPNLSGQPTDPQRFGVQDLMERELSYGRSGFNLQFMLDTAMSDMYRFPLKLRDLIVLDIGDTKAPTGIQYGSGPEQLIKDIECIGMAGDRWFRPMFYDKERWLDYEGIIMAIDPSGRGADQTAYVVVAQMLGKLFLLDAGGIPGGYGETVLQALALKAKRYAVKRIVIEDNFGDGMFEALLKPVLKRIYPCTTEGVRHNIQKEKRIIDTLEPVMNQHRLVVSAELVRNDVNLATGAVKNDEVDFGNNYMLHSLFYQMTNLTKDRGALKHDDLVDCLAIAVAYWTKSMAKDEVCSFEQYNESLLDKELESFRDSVFGRSGNIHNTWTYTGPRRL